MSMDAHTCPPESLRVLFKKWQKSTIADVDGSDDILDFMKLDISSREHVVESVMRTKDSLVDVYTEFLSASNKTIPLFQDFEPVRYELKALPGRLECKASYHRCH
jgi:hypothetical protein